MSLSWFPLYHGDYLRDTRSLSAAEHGAYLLLLMEFFQSGPLPDNVDRLCLIAANASAETVRHVLTRYWELTDAGWTNRKAEKVRDQQLLAHEKRVNAGRLGGTAKASNAIAMLEQCHQQSPKQCSSNQNQISLVTNVTRDRRRFAPPAVEDVNNFAAEQNLEIDAAAFVDFYASKGWTVGRSPMRDWRAAVRNWVRRQDGKAKGNGAAPRTREEWESWGRARGVQARRGESLNAYVARLQAAYEQGSA